MRKVGELPPTATGKYERKPLPEHVEIIRKLDTDPGAWFEIKTLNTPSSAGRFAGNIRHSQFVAFRGRRFEATAKGCTVFARSVKG